MLDEFLYTEKYRPKTIADAIVPKSLKERFLGYVSDGNVPNLIIAGKAGTGKTTLARATLDELGCSYLVTNGSKEGRSIDVLRNEWENFASSLSFKKKRKYILIDEADGMNISTVQPALRNFMETFSKNCGFILTCNYPNKLMPEMHSRAAMIEFKMPKEERASLITQFYKRCVYILGEEGVEFEKGALVAVIAKYYPDWRRCLNELQSYAASNKRIDTGILANRSFESIKPLLTSMKAKNFTEVRKWCAENTDFESPALFRTFFDSAPDFLNVKSIPELVLIINDHQDKATRVADPEINIAAFCVNVMVNCEFK